MSKYGKHQGMVPLGLILLLIVGLGFAVSSQMEPRARAEAIERAHEEGFTDPLEVERKFVGACGKGEYIYRIEGTRHGETDSITVCSSGWYTRVAWNR